MEYGIEEAVWQWAAQAYAGEFAGILTVLLDQYRRRPGQDHPGRLCPESIGCTGYAALRTALKAHRRRDVWFFDFGWCIEIRSRLRSHLLRNLQRLQVIAAQAPDSVLEDLLGHEIGV